MNDSDLSQTDSDPNLKPEKLHFLTKLAYGAGDFGTAITANILVFYLLPFFTNVAGLSAGIAGSILMIGKISDAINDPIIGILSDRSNYKWGRRLPWMLFGGLPFALIFALQWLVPHWSDNQNTNSWLLFIYYVFIGVIFNLAYTIINLPYTALTPELTQDYDERTNLNSFRFTFSIGGSILSLIIAAIIFSIYKESTDKQFLYLGISGSILALIGNYWCALSLQERGAKPILNNKKRYQLGMIIIAITIIIPILSVLKIFFFPPLDTLTKLILIVGVLVEILLILFSITLLFSKPETHLIDAQAVLQKQQQNQNDSLPFKEQLKIVFANKAFLYVIGIYLASWLAIQLTASILLYFVVNWMGLTIAQSSLVALAVQGTALILLFIWQIICKKLGKKVTYFMGTAIWLIAQIGLFLLQPGQVFLLYTLAILAGFGVSVAYLIPWSMIPDVIELDELNTGQRREGIFYGFMVLLQKIGLALGLFIVGILLQWAGFQESVAGEAIPIQPESALMAIRLSIAPLPALSLILGLVLAYFYPITSEVHAQIRLQLYERNQNHKQI